MSSTQRYLIHDNGGRPFRVDLTKEGVVSVYTVKRPWTGPIHPAMEDYSQLIHSWPEVEQVYVGGDVSLNPPHDNLGNTILLQLDSKKGRYAFIGSTVFEFHTHHNEHISLYHSQLGRNDVPYPVAVGEFSVYFPEDGVFVERSGFEQLRVGWPGACLWWHNHYDQLPNPGALPIDVTQKIARRQW